jgi:HD-like signal output (HDOD) protein
MKVLSEEQTQRLLAGIVIPPRPTVVSAILEERRRDVPDLRRVADLISADVALAAAILKTVNSPLYGLRRQISAIDQAVGMLGMHTVATLVTGLALRTAVPAQGLDRFWDGAARTALVSGYIAKHLGCVAPADAHLFGLFRDCGIPLLLQRFGDYKETLRRANAESERAFTEVEDDRHATNHAVVGSLLAANWGLSEDLRTAIRVHHELDVFQSDHTPNVMNLVAVGILAEHIENAHSRLSSECEWRKLGEAALEHLMMREEDMAELASDAHAMLEESGQ